MLSQKSRSEQKLSLMYIHHLPSAKYSMSSHIQFHVPGGLITTNHLRMRPGSLLDFTGRFSLFDTQSYPSKHRHTTHSNGYMAFQLLDFPDRFSRKLPTTIRTLPVMSQDQELVRYQRLLTLDDIGGKANELGIEATQEELKHVPLVWWDVK